MLERSIPVLRIVCLALAAVIVLQVAWLLARKDPLADVRIPNIAAASPTNAPASDNSGPANAPITPGHPAPAQATSGSTSALASAAASHPSPAALKAGAPPPHPHAIPGRPGGPGGPMLPSRGPGFSPGAGGPGAQALVGLPPQVKARVDRITQSQILGPVMHPPPMALLGIAGRDVFLRAPSGQTGMIREGEELGGVKLLQVGFNRVLVEVDGQKQELTIFAGLGSETLLPKGKENPQ